MRWVDVESYRDPDATYQTGFLSQYATLTRRNFLRQKDRYLSTVWLVEILVTSVALGVVWFQLPRVEATARDRFGLVIFHHKKFTIAQSRLSRWRSDWAHSMGP